MREFGRKEALKILNIPQQCLYGCRVTPQYKEVLMENEGLSYSTE